MARRCNEALWGFWREVVAEQAASAVTVAQFWREHELKSVTAVPDPKQGRTVAPRTIKRRAVRTSLPSMSSCHNWRAAGITAYLQHRAVEMEQRSETRHSIVTLQVRGHRLVRHTVAIYSRLIETTCGIR